MRPSGQAVSFRLGTGCAVRLLPVTLGFQMSNDVVLASCRVSLALKCVTYRELRKTMNRIDCFDDEWDSNERPYFKRHRRRRDRLRLRGEVDPSETKEARKARQRTRRPPPPSAFEV